MASTALAVGKLLAKRVQQLDRPCETCRYVMRVRRGKGQTIWLQCGHPRRREGCTFLWCKDVGFTCGLWKPQKKEGR